MDLKNLEKCLYTIGHSNLPIEKFLETILAFDIEILVDVRKMPRSRANPQFNESSLSHALEKVGITYMHAPGLAGLRRVDKNSINTGWRNKSFQAFADYMQSKEFYTNLSKLLKLARESETVIMCAESLPWRCHRSLIADAAVAKGWEVNDILSASNAHQHLIRDFAAFKNGKIYYPSR
jgi:uncharacterized protein (DUF488 family)